MKKFSFFSILFVLILLIFNSVKTQDSESGLLNALKSHNGLMMVYNKEKNNFKFEIECQNAVPFDAESMAFLMDDRFFQLVIVPVSEVVKKTHSNMSELEILSEHKKFEMDYIYEVSGMNFTSKTDTLTNISDRKFLFWELKIPLTPQDTASDMIKSKMYMTTLIGDEILSISMAVTINDNPESAKKLLNGVTRNFEHNEFGFNVEQISDSLKSIK